MRFLLLLTAFCILACEQRQKKVKEFPLLIKMFSPKSKLSLYLNNGKFSLLKNEFVGYDVILSDEITTGSYSIKNDVVSLKGVNGKKYTLKIKNEEILQPIDFDTLKDSYNFLAWQTNYDNGQPKKSGGWTEKNEKDGVWTFYDEKGEIKNQKLYKKGKLVNDNFKFDK